MSELATTIENKPARVGTLLTPIASVEAIMAAHDELAIVLQKCLKEGRDYGKIPGTERAALLKPGAETLTKAFGLYPSFEIVADNIDHDHEFKWTKKQKVWANKFRGDKDFTWKVEEGIGYGLYRYVVKCSLIHRASGEIVGTGTGTCSSMESKYIDRPRDCENTILKMAEKRALVGAVLMTFGLSDRFDSIEEDAEEVGKAVTVQPVSASQQTPEPATPVGETPTQKMLRLVGEGNKQEFIDTAIEGKVSWQKVVQALPDNATVEEAFAALISAIDAHKPKDEAPAVPEAVAPESETQPELASEEPKGKEKKQVVTSGVQGPN